MSEFDPVQNPQLPVPPAAPAEPASEESLFTPEELGMGLDLQMQETIKEVIAEDYPSLTPKTEPQPKTPPPPGEFDPGKAAADVYIKQREEMLNMRMRELAEREARLAREVEILSRAIPQTPPGQPQQPAEQPSAFDQMVDERVQQKLDPLLRGLQEQQTRQQLAGTLNTMMTVGRSSPNMPEFDRVAGLGADMLGTNASLQILRENAPQQAAEKLYALGLGILRQRVASGQAVQTPPANPNVIPFPQTQQPLNDYNMGSSLPGLPQAPPLPRGPMLRGGGQGGRGPSFQQIDEMLSGDDITSTEYEKFSREHPDLLKRYLMYGTTDPSYDPSGGRSVLGGF